MENAMENASFILYPKIFEENSTSYIVKIKYPDLNVWMEQVVGCFTWAPTNHILFQIGNSALGIGLLAPDTTYGLLSLHGLFTLGFLLLSIWSWVILCAPDFFSWNFAFMIMNAVQTLFHMYHIRPVRFCDELEDLYIANFEPLRVSRSSFKKLVCADYCTMMTLHEGESYCTQSITKTDKLGLLISGVMSVYCNRNFLHHIKAKQFIDSPEFESSVTGEEKFQVSIVAGSSCRYIFWPRQSLEYLLIKEPYLAYVMSVLLGRDITNKLYALNEKVVTPSGSRMDIRLPSVSNTIKSRHDIRKAVVGIPSESNMNELMSKVNSIDIDTDSDDSCNGKNVKAGLLNGHVTHSHRQQSLSTCGESPKSQNSINSGVHFEM
ncbi:popeye domain-containing protein 3 isoform X1 [Patella vulgata]|uniref:popeye domain-containing protein 3 isoform X1 n=1 Tax=Patella vulgata TaxID=6465 RepID=UPI00217F98D7|nr:popeye domain-containing protein 3 isoform X1 [Patella vulgata]